MTRRPLLEMVQLSIAVPRGEEGFWAIILELDRHAPWTVRQVADRTNVALQDVAAYVMKLRRGGYAEAIAENAHGRPLPAAKVYRLVKRPLQSPRLSREGRELPEPATEQLWRAMKMLKHFTPADLAEACQDDVSIAAAKNYAYQLAAAGVVSKGAASFHLVKNLGARAPKILDAKLVFDPNSRKVVGASVTREVRSSYAKAAEDRQ